MRAVMYFSAAVRGCVCAFMSRRRGSNPWPHSYQECALSLSYDGKSRIADVGSVVKR